MSRFDNINILVSRSVYRCLFGKFKKNKLGFFGQGHKFGLESIVQFAAINRNIDNIFYKYKTLQFFMSLLHLQYSNINNMFNFNNI